jgi:hypothetical protein
MKAANAAICFNCPSNLPISYTATNPPTKLASNHGKRARVFLKMDLDAISIAPVPAIFGISSVFSLRGASAKTSMQYPPNVSLR